MDRRCQGQQGFGPTKISKKSREQNNKAKKNPQKQTNQDNDSSNEYRDRDPLHNTTSPSNAHLNSENKHPSSPKEIDSPSNINHNKYYSRINSFTPQPDSAEALENKANAYLRKGELDAAIRHFRECLTLKPGNMIVLYNTGLAYQQNGELSSAIDFYQQALSLDKENPQILNNLGLALHASGERESAIGLYKKALAVDPSFISSYINIGLAFESKEDCNSAINYYKRGLKIDPSNYRLYYNLGVSLQQGGHLKDAIRAYNSAIDIDPNQSKPFQNLGAIYQETGDLSTSISYYQRALESSAHNASIRKNLGMAQLQSGDYQNGLLNYEYRLECNSDKDNLISIPQCPKWEGGLLNDQNPLLLVSEQGLGDTLQFMRFALDLRDKGIQTSFCAPEKLHDLIKVSGIDSSPLHPEEAKSISKGRWIPLLSVLKYLTISPENPGTNKPYIKTKPELEQKWSDILSTQRKPIIGINWQGNPTQEKSITRGRSMPLSAFSILPKLCNCSLISLQKGYGSEQLENCSFSDSFVSCQELINNTWNFLETAAIIQNCDLVITTDTSVAHLSAGMGKTTWLLLKYIPEWRWGLQGEKTFWYPSMRLFRQSRHDNWANLLKKVAIHADTYLNSLPANHN